MKYLLPTVIACLLIIGAAGAYITYDLYREGRFPLAYSPIQSHCHGMLTERLKSPSSLKILSSDQFVSALNYEAAKQAIRADETSADIASLRIDRLTAEWPEISVGKLPMPMHYVVVVKYDADNSFGTALRGQALCGLSIMDGQYPTETRLRLFMRLDGKTSNEWLLESFKNAN